MDVYTVEHRQTDTRGYFESVLMFVGSSEEKAREFCRRYVKKETERDKSFPWWFVICKEQLDNMDLEDALANGYGRLEAIIDWNGGEIDYQPTGGYRE